MSFVAKGLTLGRQLVRIGLFNPGRLRHVLGSALAASNEVADRSVDLLCLPMVSPEDLLPEPGRVPRASLALFPKTHAGVSTLEMLCLILLLKRTKGLSVFEFGTYKGVTITQLALNMPEQSRILTLDLPEEHGQVRYSIPDPQEFRISAEKGKGALVPEELRPRIQFLRQDSAAFDESPFAGQMDFVFVDGAHSKDYVRNDSEKGWRMLRQGGIMAWHDCCGNDRDVVRYLVQSPYRPTRIAGTSLAFAIKH